MSSFVTPLDVRDAVAWITSRWPSSTRDWGDWESFAADYAQFSVGSLKEALHTWHRRGESRGPNTSQLAKLVAEVHAARVERGVENVDRSCLGRHVFADPWPSDTDRRSTCVLCGQAGAEVTCRHPLTRQSDGKCMYCPATGVQAKPIETIQPVEALI